MQVPWARSEAGPRTDQFHVVDYDVATGTLTPPVGLTTLDASGTVLPFTIHCGGCQSVTNQQPEAVMIGPGGSAFVTFGKYRCDVGDKALVQEVKVILPNASAPTGLDLCGLSHGQGQT